MKRIFIIILCIIMLELTGCSRVAVSSADELCLSSWEYMGKNGMSARLDFVNEKAKLTVSSSSYDEAHTIEGTYSVDSQNLYITDISKYRTYTFAYEVYADRVYLSYRNDTIKFVRVNQDIG